MLQMKNDPERLKKLHIVGIGGTTRSGSSTERVLRAAMDILETAGVKTDVFAGPDLCFPPYAGPGDRDPSAQRYLDALRSCDGIVIATPSYHGSISGLVKNAIDYTEDMRADERVYFDRLPVGAICCAGGWQAASHTLGTMRSIIHALRGWPTPMGVLVNTSLPVFSAGGELIDGTIKSHLKLMVDQIVDFADRFRTPPVSQQMSHDTPRGENE